MDKNKKSDGKISYSSSGLIKKEEIVLDGISATYCQESDSCVPEEVQELRIFTENVGGGSYYVIETDRWAFNDIEDLIRVLNDFKKRMLL